MREDEERKDLSNQPGFLFIAGDGKIQQVKVYLYTIHVTKCVAPEVRAAHGREPHLASSG